MFEFNKTTEHLLSSSAPAAPINNEGKLNVGCQQCRVSALQEIPANHPRCGLISRFCESIGNMFRASNSIPVVQNEALTFNASTQHQAPQNASMVPGNIDAVMVANKNSAAPDKAIESIKHKTGIVTAHLPGLLSVAKKYDCIIGICPVDPLATGLIEEGHPTKGINIKGKSASWGPQAGTICVNQTYSKLEDRPGQIDAFSKKTEECIDNQHVFSVPLTLSRARLDFLCDAGKLTDLTRDPSGVIKFNAPGPSGTLYCFEAILKAENLPLSVMANRFRYLPPNRVVKRSPRTMTCI
jgi:hypothetical protein